MKALIVLITMFSLWFDLSNGKPRDEVRVQRSPSQQVMDSLSPADRPHFVAYHISKGLIERHRTDVTFEPVVETIPLEKREEFAQIYTPSNFSTNLLDWTEWELVPIKNGHVTVILGSAGGSNGEMEVCFPSGCVDPNDAGQLCCPF